MRLTIEITGREKIAAVFNELPEKLQKGPMRRALRAGAKVVQEFARREIVLSAMGSHPPDPHMVDHLHVRAMKRDRSKRSRIGYVVISGRREELGIPPGVGGYYPAHVEFGHFTRKPRLDALVMAAVRRGAEPTRILVHHVPANPYMKRALEASRAMATAEIGRVLGDELKDLAGLDRAASDSDLGDAIDAEEVA